ncbi:MAG: 2OG-Fe(II) oxygenase family protein [Porticoccaceae bacterium]|nr:2OG-Fe(II) oxygenase family protein [Porticoccaceae bacterium]
MTISRQWLESSDVIPVFPTLIWQLQLSPDALTAVNTQLLQTLSALRSDSGQAGHSSSWQSRGDLHQCEAFSELVAYIQDTSQIVLRFLKIPNDAMEITGCWANINPPGAAHRCHSHPNNFISGVYYLQTPAGGDTINFHDPRVQTGIIRPPVTELTAENTDQVVVKVGSGTLLMFPSFLQHSVDTNRGEGERISVGFNLMFSSFTENLSKPLW